MTVRFDRALRLAVDLAAAYEASLACPVIVVRTVGGQILLVADDRGLVQDIDLSGLGDAVIDTLGSWAAAPGLLLASKAVAPDELVAASPRVTLTSTTGAEVAVVERMLLGSDWLAPPLGSPSTARVTMFGFKGGVGRTTAAIALAVHAARHGRTVLLIDLDLESPGLGPSLLGANLPEFGVVDHLVEDAVGQAGDLASGMAMELALPDLGLKGRIFVAPARGATGDEESYPAKLARAYVDSPPAGGAAQRIHRAVCALESEFRPNLTILDSRAGLDVLAAIAVTRLGALSFLFGVDTSQTWEGYRTLFQSWRGTDVELLEFRRTLKAVASFLPEVGTDEAFAKHRDHALDCFSDYLDDEQGPDDVDGFNFEPDDPDAPHYPLPIIWTEGLRAFDPLADVSRLQSGVSWAALEPFCIRALSLALDGGE